VRVRCGRCGTVFGKVSVLWLCPVCLREKADGVFITQERSLERGVEALAEGRAVHVSPWLAARFQALAERRVGPLLVLDGGWCKRFSRRSARSSRHTERL